MDMLIIWKMCDMTRVAHGIYFYSRYSYHHFQPKVTHPLALGCTKAMILMKENKDKVNNYYAKVGSMAKSTPKYSINLEFVAILC